MDGLGITSFDILVLIVLGVSAIYGFGRGFTLEILSLGAWVGAIIATLYLLPVAQPLMRDFLDPPGFADTVTVILLGVVTLIIFKILANVISRAIKSSAIGPLDRSMGALFGVVRGLLIVCVAYLVTTWIIPQKNLPDWILQARSRPLVEYGASILADITPAEIIESLNGDDRPLDRTMIDGLKDRLPAPSLGREKNEGQGYRAKEREDLERLIEHNI
ncbi:MAG TPA: CvpA family protein [Sphingomonadales bacterium]